MSIIKNTAPQERKYSSSGKKIQLLRKENTAPQERKRLSWFIIINFLLSKVLNSSNVLAAGQVNKYNLVNISF